MTMARTAKQRIAQRMVSRAINAGILILSGVCQRCGVCDNRPFRRMDAHHHDYDKPLEVEWVCRRCHIVIHDQGNASVNAYSEIRQSIFNDLPIAKGRSRYRGVQWDSERGKWAAIVHCGRRVIKRRFDDEAEAAKARDKMAVEAFGTRARLNFPDNQI